MKPEKTMLQYVLEQKLLLNIQGYEHKFRLNICNYANFLNQSLNISMFVPCDSEGNVLEEPQPLPFQDRQKHDDKCKEYQIAKENVIFEGFKMLDGFKNIVIDKDKKLILLKNFDIIKDLISFGLTLNPNNEKVKKIFL